VAAKVVKRVNRRTLVGEVYKNVEWESMVHTDGLGG